MPGDDDNYRQRLEALERGKLTAEQVGELGEQAGRRLRAAGAPFEYDRCTEVFAFYWHRFHLWPATRDQDERIREAALGLAEALERSGRSGFYQLFDEALWDRMIKSDIAERMKRAGRWPPDYSVTASLETYLRALAGFLEEYHGEMIPKANDALMPPNSRPALKPFVVRWVRPRIDALGNHLDHTPNEREQIPGPWRPRAVDNSRAPHGNNKIAADLCRILLAEPISPRYVSARMRGK